MRYKNILKGAFIERPNRFISKVRIGDEIHTVHVKNTGRCRELLVQGCTVYLSEADNPARKTRFDLIAVEKLGADGRTILVNMDSQCPNAAAFEWITSSGIFSPTAVVRREVTHGDSRFDLYVEDGERRAFIEIKGVTLEEDGVAKFPDAPTERGVKHLRGLADAVSEGFEAYVLFVIQMKGVTVFTPNITTDPEFAKALGDAASEGVGILAYDCRVSPDELVIDAMVPVSL